MKVTAPSFLLTLLLVSIIPVAAQEVLPKPDPPFDGKIGYTWKDSTPGNIPTIKAPAGAPNVLLILIDDAGFGQPSTFGGSIPTPTFDHLAEHGLRYTRYHTTALCSPTRAALLTGRNHHLAGTGVVTEIGTSYPGYSGRIPKSCAIVAETLRENGFSTAAFGKWHNTPDWETSAAGPFDRWPTHQGFDKFYGFMGGESNQWQPALYDGTNPIEMTIPAGREGKYTLNDALADQAIDWVHQEKSAAPDRPFFLYYAPGATHAPHQVPKEWIEKFKGQFDQGWDKYREETFERQKKLGVIPKEAELTPRPKEIPAWNTLSLERKTIASRLMEVFAAYTAQTDYEVGRLIDSIGQVGQLNNTLIFYEFGDNGASGEGGIAGVFNEMSILNGVEENPAFLTKHLDEIGGPTAYNHIPAGWAWAMNTPFQWMKQVSSHFGGTRNPLVISYPKVIHDQGGIRTQFHHCIDIVPTILEAAGVGQPVEVDGVKQTPIEGTSMMYTFADTKAGEKRDTQYFEMLGTRALYHDGWIACARHDRIPWTIPKPSDFSKDEWNLYDLHQDYSQSKDLAFKYPEKLKELQNIFLVEAKKNDVLPLDDRAFARTLPGNRPSLVSGRTLFTYFAGAKRIPEGSAAPIKNCSYSISVDADIPKKGANGVLACDGGIVGGWTLYVKDNKPVFEYNYLSTEHTKIGSKEALPPGPVTIKFDFMYTGVLPGKGGFGKLSVNNRIVAFGRIDKTVPGRFSADETFDTGCDTASPVGDYASPFTFNGNIRSVQIHVTPNKVEEQILRRMSLQNDQIEKALD